MMSNNSAVALLLLSLSACIPFGDPQGPGAEGTVEIPDHVDTKAFRSLVVRMVPRDGEFDPEAPDFGADAHEHDVFHVGYELDGSERAVEYDVGEVVGTTPHKRWRVFAWLSTERDGWESSSAQRPPPGAPYGVADFVIERCKGYGDYCGVQHDLDLSLSEVAP